jgi:hypothetical protein
MNLDAALQSLKETLILLSRNQATGRFMLSDAKLISDALVTLGDVQSVIQEEQPSDYAVLNKHELAAFKQLRDTLTVSDNQGLSNVMSLAMIRIKRLHSMGAVLYQQPEFELPIEHEGRIVAQFEAWLAYDEQTDGCRGLSNLEVDQMRDAWKAAAIKYRSLPRLLTTTELAGLARKHEITSIFDNVPNKLDNDTIQKFSEDLIKLVHS